MKYENWIFDFDGTLIDESVYSRVYPAIIKAISKVKSEKEINDIVNELPKNKLGLVDTYQLCLKLDVLDLYYDILPGFITESIFKSGIKSLLKSLKSNNTKIVVVTSSHRKIVELFLAFNDLITYVDVIWAFEDSNFNKDHSEYWSELSQSTNIKPEESMVVSDSLIEVMKAKTAGFSAKHLGTDVMSLEELQ